jgi:hypothetical protein
MKTFSVIWEDDADLDKFNIGEGQEVPRSDEIDPFHDLNRYAIRYLALRCKAAEKELSIYRTAFDMVIDAEGLDGMREKYLQWAHLTKKNI